MHDVYSATFICHMFYTTLLKIVTLQICDLSISETFSELNHVPLCLYVTFLSDLYNYDVKWFDLSLGKFLEISKSFKSLSLVHMGLTLSCGKYLI